MAGYEDPHKLKEVFFEALERSGNDRESYLDRVCASEPGLREQVEALLRQNTSSGSGLLQTELIPPNHTDFFPPGELLSGRFEILRSLGRGGMGEVYAANDRELGVTVALKTVRAALASDEGVMTRFRREIQLSRQVTHPNVCRVFDLGRHAAADGRSIVFLTMECLSGETLKDRLKQCGPIAPHEAAVIATQIAAGLTALHDKGILHRDLKPANVMLTVEGSRRAVIMDFGIAREAASDASADLTKTGLVVGTPGYMAPEQIYRATATAASDIYSLGVILYEMITAKRYTEPFERGKSGLPSNWESAILHCLEKDPAERPSSALAAVAQLSPLGTGSGKLALGEPAVALVVPADTMIGPYRVLRAIGKHYLAEDIHLGRQTLLRILPPEFAADPQKRRQFEQDAKLASRLNHPAAAAIYGFGEWPGGYYVALEYVDGETLESRLQQRGALDLEEVARSGAQLAELLDAAQAAGLSPPALHPRNVMFSPQGALKLLDFGLVSLSAVQDRILAQSPQVAAYLSPEHALEKPVDIRSHIFSLGALLLEMAAARPAFPGKTAAEVISRILSGIPRWGGDIPPELERIFRKCLEKDPGLRYQSPRELALDLRAWQRGGTGTLPVTAPPPLESVVIPSRPANRRKFALTVGGAALAAAAAGVGIYRWGNASQPDSLAIFPFATTDEASQILSDGLTESLIDQVASAGSLRVLARTAVFRFKKIDDPIATAKKLNAAMLVAGKLTADKDLVHISLELVDAETSAQRWKYAASSPLGGLQALASQLAEQLLRALGVRRNPSASNPQKKAADPEAYRLFLRGRHTLIRRLPESFVKASELFQKAIEIDPLYAQPYAGLADVYWLQSGDRPPNDVAPKSKAAALKAIELDPNLADAHAALGSVQVHYDLAWVESEKSFQRAIALNPSYPQAHSSYARLLTARKRFAEAEAEQKKAIALDPLAVPALTSLGMTYYYARRFDDATAVLTKALADQPGSIQARAFLGLVQVAQEKYTDAIATLEESIKRMGEDDYGLVSDLGMAYALSGNLAKGRECLARVERMGTKLYSAPCFQAGMLLALGMKDRALTALEQSVDPDHSWPVMYYAVEPKLDPVRGEPRFIALLRKTGAVL